MTCPEVRRDLVALADGGLNDVLSEAIRAHLAFCPDCRAEAHSVRATLELASAYRVAEMPKGTGIRIRVGLRDRIAHRRSRRGVLWLPLAGSAVLAIGILFLVLSRWNPAAEPSRPLSMDGGPVTERMEIPASVSEDTEIFERVVQQLADLEGGGSSSGSDRPGREVATPNPYRGEGPAPAETRTLLREYRRGWANEEGSETLLRDLSDEEFDQVIQKVEEGLSG